MRRALVVLAAAGLGLVAVGPSALAAHRSLPRVATQAPPGFGFAYEIRPPTIWFTGDSTGILGRIARTVPAVGRRPGFLRWKTWTRRRAYAVGIEWYRSGGGAGPFHRTAVTVTLSQPRDGRFVKMILRDRFGVATWCNPPRITYWTIPSGPLGSTSCGGA